MSGRSDASCGGVTAQRLYRIVIAAVGRKVDRNWPGFEDLVQEVLTRAILGLSEKRFEGRAELTTWVTAIARNVTNDSLRGRDRHGTPRRDSHPDIAEVPASVDLENQVDARKKLGVLARFLTQLEPTTADIVLMHDVYGRDLAEIAKLKQLSIAATQSRLVRARKRLARRLRL